MRRKKEKKNAARENAGYSPIPMEDPESGAMRDDDETLVHAAYAKQNMANFFLWFLSLDLLNGEK